MAFSHKIDYVAQDILDLKGYQNCIMRWFKVVAFFLNGWIFPYWWSYIKMGLRSKGLPHLVYEDNDLMSWMNGKVSHSYMDGQLCALLGLALLSFSHSLMSVLSNALQAWVQ